MRAKYMFLSALSVILHHTAFAQHDLESKGILLARQGYDYTVDFKLADYTVNSRNVSMGRSGSETFTFVDIPGYGITYEEGRPQLPQVSFFLAIPSDMDRPEIKTDDIQTKSVRVTHRIYPAQHVKTTETPDTRKFVVDNAAYSGMEAGAVPFVDVSEPVVVSGVRGVRITISPFQYSPAGKSLTVRTGGKFTVKLGKPIDVNVAHTESMDEYLNAFFVNYGDCRGVTGGTTLKAAGATAQYPKGNYLLIVPGAYANNNAMRKFIEHKKAMGFNVYTHEYEGKMAGYDYFTGAPYCLTFASPTGIKTAIQNKYNTLSTRPEHVLLVGDHGDIGTWEYDVDGETVNSDLGYTQLDGSDVFADVKFGRWPVANEQELENIVNKTITMENKFRASTISPKRATLIADYDLTFEMVLWGCMFDETIDTIRQPIIDDGYSDEFINKRTGGTPPRVIAALNDNPYLVVYNGHGDVDEWVGPSFTAGNASNLSNTIYPVIFSSACYTGNFIHAGDPSASPCLGEEFIRRAHGACAFWGATRTTYVYWDHHLTRAVFNDGFKQTGSIAGMINIGIRDIANRIGNFMYAHRAISITAYHLFGDPSLQVRYNDCETDMKLYAGATDAGETVQYRPAANITVAGDAPSYVPGQYTVKSGGSLTLKANETIVLKPGFVAEAGSTFSASITSETCTPGSSSGMAPTRAGESIAEAIIETTDEDAGIAPDTGPSIEAYPNPFTESFTLSFNCDVPADVFVRLYDMSGNLIKVVAANTQYGAGTHQLTVNGAGLAQGVYLLQLNINRKNIVFKIVKTE